MQIKNGSDIGQKKCNLYRQGGYWMKEKLKKMMKRDKRVSQKTRRKGTIRTRLLVIPLSLLLVGFILVGSVSSYLTKESLSDQMREEGIFVSEQFASKVSDNQESLDTINFLLEDLIRGIGKTVITNQEGISNEYLVRLANDMGVYEINYTDADGLVTHSNLESSLGAVFGPDHISHAVLGNKDLELMEDIRGSRETDDFYKYGYVLNPNGGMVQVGLLANNIQALTEKFSYQVAVEEIVTTDNIVYVLYLDRNNEIIAASNPEEVGTSIDDKAMIDVMARGEVYSAESYYTSGDINVYDIVYPFESNGEVIGAIKLGYSMESMETAINKTRVLLAVICIAAFLIIGAILYITISKCISTIHGLGEQLGYIADGDLTRDLDQGLLENNDEFGEMAIAVDNMQKSIRDIISQVTNKSQEVSTSSESLTASSQEVAASAREIFQAIEDIANGATEQTRDTHNAAEAIEGIGRLIAEDEEQIRELNGSANLIDREKEDGFSMLEILTEKAQQSTESSREVYDIILTNNESAEKINQASNMIQDIADQTNLLALNAAIEASRAGDAGRGFSVVADEIRNLAEQSNIFASEINEVIRELQTQSQEAVDTMEVVQGVVEEQAKGVEDTYDKFEAIARAIDSINLVIEKLNESSDVMMENKNHVISLTQNLSTISEHNSAGIEESSAILEEQSANVEDIAEAGSELSNIAEELQATIDRFRI